ncbi:hypothetical protein [Amycolatopsis sp. NPDC051372]|uniref:hypothetical protein n=1 Tax=unclassified Amycolatopsis TaxID=2618356 RepID=UPI003435FAEA
MRSWTESGEALSGRYSWVSDGLIVCGPSGRAIVSVREGLLDNGQFTRILQRLG